MKKTPALLSYYNCIDYGNVKPGLRTMDKYHPFSKEINRCIEGAIAYLYFAPPE